MDGMRAARGRRGRKGARGSRYRYVHRCVYIIIKYIKMGRSRCGSNPLYPAATLSDLYIEERQIESSSFRSGF